MELRGRSRISKWSSGALGVRRNIFRAEFFSISCPHRTLMDMNDAVQIERSSPTDETLLGQFVRQRSDDAFRQLAERHAELVHGTALRLLKGDAARADDAAQAVFIVLAQKAASIKNSAALAAWLYRTTALVVENMRRVDARRRKHEEQAGKAAEAEKMGRGESDSPAAEITRSAELAELNEALAGLKPRMQEAVVLHYLKHLPREEVARTLGCSLEAIHKRLSTALEQLRASFHRKGVKTTSLSIGMALAAQSAYTPPAGCAGACHAAAMGALKSSAISAPSALAKGVIKMLWWSKLKSMGIAAGAAFALLAGGIGAQHLLRAGEPQPPVKPVAANGEKGESGKAPVPGD